VSLPNQRTPILSILSILSNQERRTMTLPMLVFLIILCGLVTDSPIHLVHSGFLGLLAYYSISITSRVLCPSLFRVSGGKRRLAASVIGLWSYSCGLLVSIWVHCLWDY